MSNFDPNSVGLRVFESPTEAPNYRRDSVDVRSLVIKSIDLIKKGTVGGRCTVDFVLTAEDGSQFVAMTTGRIISSVASMIQSIDSQ